MTDLTFQVEPPSPNSDLAHLHVIDYVRLPTMLKLFEETAGFSLGSLSQVDKFFPEPMPLQSHKTVIDYAKYIKETYGKSTISIRIPVPTKLSNVWKELDEFKLRFVDIERRLAESQKQAQEQAKKSNRSENVRCMKFPAVI